MTDQAEILRRQQAGQAGRARLTWGEKIRLAEEVREDVRKWARAGRGGDPVDPSSAYTPPSPG